MKILKKLILFILITVVLISGVFTFLGYRMYKNAIEKNPLDTKISSIKKENSYARFEELPKMYVDAVLAVEDHRFYEHNGIDIIGIFRAIINNIKAKELKEGGSTITQQLAKNIYFTQDRNFVRKIAEIFMAFELEKNCEKNEIFELYVNTSYFGDGYYCVKDASNGYFDKNPIDMTDYESTLLAGIPNAPSVYSPNVNPGLAKQRQKQVLDTMVRHKFLTQEEADIIL